MLISKYKDKNGNGNVSIVISKKMLHQCKSEGYVRFTLGESYKIGLDEKKQVGIKEVFNLKNLKDNTQK